MPKNPQAKAGTTKLADLLHIHPRFMRSVHLERDFADPSSSKGYVLTPVAAQTIGRIGAGFLPNSTQRAWRVNGDYGSGKTDFALALARLASGRHDELPRELRGLLPGGVRFKMALATGDAEPLGATILRATGRKVDGRTSVTTANILKVVAEAVSHARKGGAQGLVLLIDELGKNLEHAARHPEADDSFLLQRLAEEASRSGENALVVIVILHQGIAAYSGGLDAAARREWDKVAGRYEEIAFAQPIDQVAALVRATLHVDTARLPHSWSQEAAAAMGAATQAGLYGSGDGEEHVASSGTALFPLHPTVLPVIVRAMRRFGQNERSLFSFLSSAEPMGLQDHCHRHSGQMHEDPFYRIHDFFEFARFNLLPSLAGTTSSHTHWGVIEEVLSSTPTHSDAEANVLRTIALLSLLDASDMPATRETVVLAVGGDPQETGAAVDDLQRRGVAYERGTIKRMFTLAF